jgi:hypothetical protein
MELPQSLSYYLPVRKSVSYVLAWEIENHFLSDAPGDRNDQLTEKEDFPSKMPISCTKKLFSAACCQLHSPQHKNVTQCYLILQNSPFFSKTIQI